MKKIIAFLAGMLALIINFTAGAQQTKDADKSLLWQISGKGLTKPSYLFGTIHIICATDYLWTDKMKQSLLTSDKVCLEMDMDDPNVMMQAAAGLIDNTGKKLSSYFTPEQYKLVSRYIKDSMGMDITMFEQMKPVALQTLFTSKTGGCSDPVSYEENIMKIAAGEHKEVMGLEDVKEQLDALESIPADSVIHELLESITNPVNDDAEYNKLIAAYKAQDVAALYKLITQSKDMMGEDMAVFLDDRNKKWISRIEEKMKPSSVFFAVGAGHLWGPNGVINLLRKQGYKVEAMK